VRGEGFSSTLAGRHRTERGGIDASGVLLALLALLSGLDLPLELLKNLLQLRLLGHVHARRLELQGGTAPPPPPPQPACVSEDYPPRRGRASVTRCAVCGGSCRNPPMTPRRPTSRRWQHRCVVCLTRAGFIFSEPCGLPFPDSAPLTQPGGGLCSGITHAGARRCTCGAVHCS
jgi:hypothetical protein